MVAHKLDAMIYDQTQFLCIYTQTRFFLALHKGDVVKCHALQTGSANVFGYRQFILNECCMKNFLYASHIDIQTGDSSFASTFQAVW